MIKAWAFEFNTIINGREVPNFRDPEVCQMAFDDNLNHVANMENLGFEGVFFSEHHFIDSLSPSPHLLIAASAPRTKKLKLGVMGSVLPFHQPWRVAEELGMLDYITDGRLEIGVASGVPPEFLFVNVPQEDVRPMYWESLEFLEKAFESVNVTHHGKFWNFDDVPVLPAIKQVDRRRKWMTVYSASTCRAAARLGYKVVTGAQSVENANKAYDAYREEADKIGYEITPDDIGVRRHIILGPTDEAAYELLADIQPANIKRMEVSAKPVKDRIEKALGAGAMDAAVKSGVKDIASPRRVVPAEEAHLPDSTNLNAMKNLSFENFASFEDEFIIGSPSTVAEKIIDQCERMGGAHILGLHLMALTREERAENYRLWSEVIPILNKKEVNKR